MNEVPGKLLQRRSAQLLRSEIEQLDDLLSRVRITKHDIEFPRRCSRSAREEPATRLFHQNLGRRDVPTVERELHNGIDRASRGHCMHPTVSATAEVPDAAGQSFIPLRQLGQPKLLDLRRGHDAVLQLATWGDADRNSVTSGAQTSACGVQ